MWYYKSNYIEAEVAILIPKRLQNRILQGTETLSNNEEINLSRGHNSSKCLHV